MATTDKYDRQLRLWGASGQRALGQTLVALIGTSACGTETLKNLVLPGVGSILVVDDDDGGGMDNATPTNVAHGTTKSDDNVSLFKFALANSNFFLSPQDPSTSGPTSTSSSSNAARAATLLCELNPDVHGRYLTVPSLEDMDYQSFLTSLLLVESSYSSSAVQMTTMTSTNNSKKKSLLIIAADQPSSVLLPLSHACYINSIPLIAIRSYGLLGTVRVQTPSPYHPIIESRPSVRKPDLRLGTMPLFDTLRAVCETVSKLDSIVDTKDRSHVPFVIILLQALDKWRNGHDSGGENCGNEEKTDEAAHKPPPPPPYIPKTMAEKDDFRSIVKNMANNINNEMNFEEAMRSAHLVWADDRLSEDVQSVLDKVDEMSFFRNVIIESPDDNNMDVDGATSSGSGSIGGAVMSSRVLQFQLLIVALKRYLLANNNYPPLEGTIPDMTSDTSRFVALQEAYRSRAEADRAQLCNIITSLLDECKERANGCALRIAMPSDDVIQTFCKNVRYLRMLETRPLFVEYILQDKTSPVVTSYSAMFDSMKLPSSEGSSSSSNTINNFDTLQSDARDDLQSSTMDPYETDPVQTPLLWWIALRACDAFYDRHQHYPGKHDQELALEADANEVYSCMLEIVQSLGLVDGENTSELIKEYILDKVKGKDLAREVVRYDEAEIHTVAAVVGGVASQEAVKLITGQYVPIDDTYVYNGIASTAGVYRF